MACASLVEQRLTEIGILLHSGAMELHLRYSLMGSVSLRLLLRSPLGARAIERP